MSFATWLREDWTVSRIPVLRNCTADGSVVKLKQLLKICIWEKKLIEEFNFLPNNPIELQVSQSTMKDPILSQNKTLSENG